ncbi:fluoride efflux transporter CrcB [Breznakiella homolactica]|uniref:Fluoride-specific ion channel FluC n=1 Tax=Breznakiella homolactica TaxID=2798577 RepID=A0A7T7XM89_9SPIR|nr:fluoride efflux transporter CrcB [Breznakiella homolactica]QQO08812.1 fluoride efflux transporter CrcB [Breznakiella homolactica]
MNILSVALGGGIGAVLRYGSSKLAHRIFETSFPLGILLVNILGSFLIGFLFSLFRIHKVSAPAELFFITGLLGGYTTFSSYALETMVLFMDGKTGPALLNLLLSNGLCLLAVLAGLWLGKIIFQPGSAG